MKEECTFCNFKYLQNILESIDSCILVTDSSGKIMYWNESMASCFLPKNAKGQMLKNILPMFWEEYKGKIFGEIIENEIFQKGEKKEFSRFPMSMHDQKIRYFDIKGSPLRNNQNEIVGIILIFLDATENMLLENKLLRQAKTTSLANLGASIAHEIRNPLNSISLNIQLTQEWLQHPEEDNQEEILETLQNVLSEIDRLNDLIRDFLQFSRPPDPQRTLQDPTEAVQQAIRLIQENARVAHVDIILSLSLLPKIYIDRNQISQAVYNISLNAIQSMKEQGGGRLEISTFQNKDYCLIEIKDNGMGFTPGALEKLFDLFFTTREEGSGLGLPIANQIIENHDGKLVAENNLDRGACFSIYLPVNSQHNKKNQEED
ncbi:MAG TPA: ATP-binding protein [Planctomycetota bacterium]|nr:ATP-binding protein [Planctomycetota bacterium]